MKVKGYRLPLLSVFVVLFASCSDQSRMERHIARGDRFFDAGEYDKAEMEYRSAFLVLPGNPVPFGRLGVLYFNEGRIRPAYILLKKSVEDQPGDARTRLTLGLTALTLARTAEARTDAKKVLADEPQNEDALLLLADTSVSADDCDDSLKIIEALKGPRGAGYHVARGVIELTKRDSAGAESDFRKALELDPRSSAAYDALANLLEARGDITQAGQAFRSAAELSPTRSARRMRYVEFLIATGASDKASKDLAAITDKAPDFIPALIATMRLAYAHQRYDDCLSAAAKVLAREPQEFDALMQVAKVKRAKKDEAGAIDDLKRMERNFPSEPSVKYELALAYLDNRDLALAEESLKKAVALAPGFDQAIVLLAEINLRKGNTMAVVTAIEPLITRRTAITRAYFLLAQAYRTLGDLEHSLAVFRLIAESAPKAPEGHYLVGTVLREMGRDQEARDSLNQSVQLAEDYWPAQEALVDLDLTEGQDALATKLANGLMEKFPKAAAPRLLRAKVRLSARDIAGAESDLLCAIELEPTSEYAYVQLSRLYFKTNKAQAAVDELEAIAAKNGSVSVLMQLGMLHSALKQFAEARAAYERLLAIDPRFVPALNNLAVLLSENLGNPDEGYSLAKRANTLSPNDTFVNDTLGWILFHKGDYGGALPYLKQASESSTADPDIQFHVGMASYMLDQEAPARRALQNAVAASPDNPVNDEARRRIATLDIDPASAADSVETELEQQLRHDPNDPVALVRLAALEERAGKEATAADNFEAALKIAPQSVPAMVALSRIYVGPVKKPARALELAKSAHELEPLDPNISWTLGRLLNDSKEFDWSSDLLRQASYALPHRPDLLFDLAKAQFGNGRIPEAEDTLKELLSGGAPVSVLEPAQQMESMLTAAKTPALARASLADARRILGTTNDYIPALMVAALAEEDLGDFQSAGQLYERILEMDPLFAPAERRLSMLYAERLGNDQRAEDLAIKARRIFPDDPDLAYELGLLSYKDANYVVSIQFLQQCLGKRENDAEALFHIGMAYYELNDFENAGNNLRRAMGLKLSGNDADMAKRVLDEMGRRSKSDSN
jgi:tetratricopeptide (TPR) repeat protein